jgi:hypothetical protein
MAATSNELMILMTHSVANRIGARKLEELRKTLAILVESSSGRMDGSEP